MQRRHRGRRHRATRSWWYSEADLAAVDAFIEETAEDGTEDDMQSAREAESEEDGI